MRNTCISRPNVELHAYPRLTHPNQKAISSLFAEELSRENLNLLDVKVFAELIRVEVADADIILIDGGPRELITRHVLEYAISRPLIILDNSDRHSEQNLSELIKREDWLEIPFHGLGPLNPYAWTTSFFVHRTKISEWLG